MEKTWSDRFDQTLHPFIEEFNASINFDKELIIQDLKVSLAHAKMLGEEGIISKNEAEAIQVGLNNILVQALNGKFQPSLPDEDIHFAIEKRLISDIGDIGKKLHTGRSRNDQVATDIRIWTRESIVNIENNLINFQKILLKISQDNIHTIIPGYTHLQRAQPISLAHHLLAYIEMLQRDKERLDDLMKRVNISPLGAAALAGTKIPINRESTAKELGFKSIYRNSIDAVSDRDFAVEFISSLSLIMTHLSRLSEEVILWVSDEFHFASLTDRCSTGSSLMPQKKNPDVPELVRGKTGRLYGNLQALLTMIKGLPLSYNKDFQEDKEPLFDSYKTVMDSLTAMSILFEEGLIFNFERLSTAVESDFSNATDLADYLVKKGVPFREAYNVVGAVVKTCLKEGLLLNQLDLAVLQKFHSSFQEDLFHQISPYEVVKSRTSLGGTGFTRVQEQLIFWQDLLL
tara:strand:- start:453 stop:1829 length:1377 start_codon:yes stop_codon:yes gene_type:complete